MFPKNDEQVLPNKLIMSFHKNSNIFFENQNRKIRVIRKGSRSYLVMEVPCRAAARHEPLPQHLPDVAWPWPAAAYHQVGHGYISCVLLVHRLATRRRCVQTVVLHRTPTAPWVWSVGLHVKPASSSTPLHQEPRPTSTGSTKSEWGEGCDWVTKSL